MTKYDGAFYESQSSDSLKSARTVLPALLARLTPRSVVDVGCGVGTWLRVCLDQGVPEVLGVDGSYVDKSKLLIPEGRFSAQDIGVGVAAPKRYDMAMCMEVAEHLPAGRAREFVAALTRLSDVVLFSAAIPYQGGTGHVNENWLEFWVEQFRSQGYEAFDLIRPAHWDDRSVSVWYRQNALVYVRKSEAQRLLPGEASGPRLPYSIVHPEVYLWAVARGTVLSEQRMQDDIEYLYGRRDASDTTPAYGTERFLDLSGLSLPRVAKKFLLKALKATTSG